MLRTETNTPAMEREVLRAARLDLGADRRLEATFEHGQWWVTDCATGAQWSVSDWEGASGAWFLFEQVTEDQE